MSQSLSDQERLELANAIYRDTGYLPPRGVNDLSSVPTNTERTVEQIVGPLRASLERIETLCQEWDHYSKTPSPTTIAIRKARDEPGS